MSDDPQDDSKPPSRISPLKASIVLPCFLKFPIAPPGFMCP